MKKLNPSDIPSSVYRLQLSQAFPLKKATRILSYLKKLGIEAVYTSPFYDAYSTHGYDVTNPNQLNPALGTPEDFDHFCMTLKKLEMGLILDIVPNHMGIKGGRNPWWQDVLENGPFSEYASFFDVDWSPEKRELQDKVLLPILGAPYGTVLENQEIHLSLEEGKFWLHYNDYPLPISPHTYTLILEEIQEGDAEFQEVLDLYRQFPVSFQERRLKAAEGRQKIQRLPQKKLARHIERFNGKKRKPESFDLLDRLIDAQFYRLTYWRAASHEINYRRFFNINELVAICIEKEAVLETHHRWIFDLIASGKVQGLRIDHPDGLYDPVHYFERIRGRFPLYTVVEKILDRQEHLPDSWAVEGTVGYEYIHLLNGLFIRQENERNFTEIYERFVGKAIDFEEVVYQSKKLFTTYHMVSEVNALGLKLDRLSENSRQYRDFTRHDLTEALQEVIASFPVYRSYIGPDGKVSKRDARYIQEAIQRARTRAPALDSTLFDFLENLLLFKLKTKPEEREGYLEFVLRFQQLTGPIMAKGLEDTTFYIYNRFISLNEVGGDPPHFGYSTGDYHAFNEEKEQKWPYGFLASSTHDTKRSEDVRMRLNVLSEMPDRWRKEVFTWAELNAKHKSEDAPTPNAEYFLYQTLLGVWPKQPLNKEEWPAFVERIWQSILKSLREARQETSWITPHLEYEKGVHRFLKRILSSEKQNPFLKEFLPFQKEIDRLGSWNALAATALKIASCGVVDIYQGNETFNYRLVDPDNREPVEFKETMDEKFAVHALALNFRRAHKALFLEGEYLPMKVRGHRKEHVVAFMRCQGEKRLLVVVGRFFASLCPNEWEKPIGFSTWGDTEVIVPKEWKNRKLVDLFTGRSVQVEKQSVRLAKTFESLPVSYLYEEGGF